MKNSACFNGRKARCSNGGNDIKNGEKSGENRDLAAVFVLAAGCMALLFFFLFASFGKNTKAISYSNYSNVEYDGAVSVFSRIILPDGKTCRNDETAYTAKDLSDKEKCKVPISSNDENVFAEDTDGWNFWQYLCDSLAEIFGVTNAE